MNRPRHRGMALHLSCHGSFIMRRLIGWAGIAAVVVGLLFNAPPARAADKSAAEMLPPSTAACLEITRPGEIIALLLDSPLSKQIEKFPQYRKTMEDPKFQEFQAIVRAVEQKAGVPWRKALENGTAGGVCLAFDPDTKGIVLLAKSQDLKITASIRDAVFELARGDAQQKGKPNPIEVVNHRDLTAWKVGEGVMSQLGPWLVIANKSSLAQKVADQFLDGSASLATDAQYKEALHAMGDPAAMSAFAFVRLDALRAMAANPPWLDPKYKSENPPLEFLVGGLAPVLRNSPFLTAAVTVNKDEVKLAIASANDPKWTPAEKKFFFASAGDGAAKPLRPRGTLASVTIYRDLSAMWQAGPDLFGDAIATKMAQADSSLSNIFGGKSFGTEVLGAIKPQMQFVLAHQDYKAAGIHEPSLRLPAGALILRTKPQQFDSIRKRFRTGYQTAIALFNLDGGAKGRPTLEAANEKRGSADVYYATYDMSDKPMAKDDVYLNFSPALVMSKNYMILCSTKQIALDLADLIGKEGDTLPTIPENTLIEIDACGAAALIKDDREQLIAQNMLEKGHDRAAAEKDVDGLYSIVDYFRSATLRLTPGEKSMKLEVDVKLKGMSQ
jgi:hypothetical protein